MATTIPMGTASEASTPDLQDPGGRCRRAQALRGGRRLAREGEETAAYAIPGWRHVEAARSRVSLGQKFAPKPQAMLSASSDYLRVGMSRWEISRSLQRPAPESPIR